MHNLYINEQIYYYKNVIENPEKIIEEINSLPQEWEFWSTKPVKDEPYKLSPYEFADYKIIDIETLNSAIKKCVHEYEKSNNIKIYKMTQVVANKYYPGKHMGHHTDASEDSYSPIITIMVNLNDNYKGGEMVFKRQNLTLKPDAGSIVIYPSREPYSHMPELITEGSKVCCTIFGYDYEDN